jgi:glycosyltransferase involved in cell wall biosynthesis
VISVVLAVYDSAPIVGSTIARIVATCQAQGWPYEVIAVDDGSRDQSLAVLRQAAASHGQVRVIALQRNGGQHAALLVGLRAAKGDPVVCLDDDLQHPPEAIPLLVRATAHHDAVFARFDERQHAWWRRPGSACMRWLDRVAFGAPPGLVVSSFRAFRRSVVDRIVAYDGPSPYIRGQALLAARHPGNVAVVHGVRFAGASSYSAMALAAVVLRVLFEWTRLPACAAIIVGGLMTGAGALRLAAGDRWWLSWAPFAAAHGIALLMIGVAAIGVRAQKGGIAALESLRDRPDALGIGVEQREARIVGRSGAEQAIPAGSELSGEGSHAAPREPGPHASHRDACKDDGEADGGGAHGSGTRCASS